MSEFKGTKGKWINKGTWVVSDDKHSREANNTKNSKKYYGGSLICESVLDEYDAKLISKSLEMLEMLKSILHAVENSNIEADVISIEDLDNLIQSCTE